MRACLSICVGTEELGGALVARAVALEPTPRGYSHSNGGPSCELQLEAIDACVENSALLPCTEAPDFSARGFGSPCQRRRRSVQTSFEKHERPVISAREITTHELEITQYIASKVWRYCIGAVARMIYRAVGFLAL